MRYEKGKALQLVQPAPMALEKAIAMIESHLCGALEIQCAADVNASQTLGRVTRAYHHTVRASEDDRDFQANLRILASLCIWGLASMDTYQPLVDVEAQPKGEQNADTHQGHQPVPDQPQG